MSLKEETIKCNNCRQLISAKKMFLHEGFCNRNNIFCEHCEKVFLKKDYKYHIFEIQNNLSKNNSDSISNQFKKTLKNLKNNELENIPIINNSPDIKEEQIDWIEEYEIKNPIVINPFGEIISKQNKNEYLLPILGIDHIQNNNNRYLNDIFFNQENYYNINKNIINYGILNNNEKRIKKVYSTTDINNIYNKKGFNMRNNILNNENNIKNYNDMNLVIKEEDINNRINDVNSIKNNNFINNNVDLFEVNKFAKIKKINLTDSKITEKNRYSFNKYNNFINIENKLKNNSVIINNNNINTYNSNNNINKINTNFNLNKNEKKLFIDNKNIYNSKSIDLNNTNSPNISKYNKTNHFQIVGKKEKNEIKNNKEKLIDLNNDKKNKNSENLNKKEPLDNLSRKSKKFNDYDDNEKIPLNKIVPKTPILSQERKYKRIINKCEYCNIITDNIIHHYNICTKKIENDRIKNIINKNPQKQNKKELPTLIEKVDRENIYDSSDDDKNNKLLVKQMKPSLISNNNEKLIQREFFLNHDKSEDKYIKNNSNHTMIKNKTKTRNNNSPKDNIKGRNMAKTQKRNFRKSNIFKLKEEGIKADINKTIKNGNDIELNYSINPLRLSSRNNNFLISNILSEERKNSNLS